MRALTAGDIVLAWEAGRAKHPVDRAMIVLRLACPEMSPEALGKLTVGQRNARLLLLRQQMLGPNAECFVRCPRCKEPLEFTVDTRALFQPESEPEARDIELTFDGLHVTFRLPNSLDLAAVALCGDVQRGLTLLLERCIAHAEQDSQEIAALNLPEQVIQAVAEAMVEQDPQAETKMAVNCSACEHHWTMLFDIVAFFWTEIERQAKRLLREVHILASAYGWREADILALGPMRRHYYLELIGT
jgi:hypothetical protein